MAQLMQNIPLVGTFEEFVKTPLDLVIKARNEGDIVKLVSEGPEFPYLLSNPEHIREVLIEKTDKFIKSKNLQVLKTVVGEGILTSEGETHRKDRQVMQPYFNMRHIAKYAQTMVQLAHERIKGWKVGEARNMTSEMMEVTLDIITATMFGVSVREETVEKELRALLNSLHKMIVEKARLEGHEPAEVSAERNRKLQESTEALDQLIYGLIEQRRANPQEERHDLLWNLLNTGMPEKVLRDQVLTVFLAGQESTANTLAWTWYLLSQHPEAEAKFHEELARVLNGSDPTSEALKALTYTTNIVQEAMRLYPAAWSIGRIATEDVEIGGHPFKKGELLMMCQYAMHRNPKWYDNADQFIPERFETDLLKRIPSYAYFPFGGGSRVCIGNHFALMEAVLLLAVIGQQYRLMLEKGTVVEPEPLITLHPKNLVMKIEKR